MTPTSQESAPNGPRLLLTVEQAADRLGIGRTLMYALIRTEQVASVRVGRLRRVRPVDLERYADGLAEGSGPSEPHAA